MDQLAALKWIHENIEGSHTYFKKVIAESGTPQMSISTEQAIEVANDLLEEVGCKTVADLKKLDAEALVKAAREVFILRALPEKDGRILPVNPLDAYADGAVKDIDLLIGCNKDEMSCWLGMMGPKGYCAWGNDLKAKKLAQLTDSEKELVESFCRDIKGEEYESLTRLLDQIWFIAPRNEQF